MPKKRKTRPQEIIAGRFRRRQRSHRLKVSVIAPPDPALGEAQAAAWTLGEYNRLLEVEVRAHPDQWLWMHRRWRSLPLHRLSGADRARAEAGAITFDMGAQVWRDAAGADVHPEGWR